MAPAIQAFIKLTIVPPIKALNPNSERLRFWLGAMAPIPPIWIPIEEKLAKPHKAKLAINMVLEEAIVPAAFIELNEP